MIKKIKSQKEKVETARPQQSKVVFGFSSLNPVSYVEAKNDSHFFISFLDRLKKLSGLEWNTIWVTHRHGLGTEMIGREALKPNIQKMVPEDMNNVLEIFTNTLDFFLIMKSKADPSGSAFFVWECRRIAVSLQP